MQHPPCALATVLQEENARLTHQYQLVEELCKCFDWFRHMQLHALLANHELMLGDDASQQLTPDSVQQQFTNLLETEVELQLLQQLSSLQVSQQNSSTACAALPASALDSGQDSRQASPASSSLLVARPGDVLWQMKQAVQQPWPHSCSSAGDITLPELMEHFRATVHTLSVQLVQFDACQQAAAQAEPLHIMRSTILQHNRVIIEIYSCSRALHLVTSLQLVRHAAAPLRTAAGGA